MTGHHLVPAGPYVDPEHLGRWMCACGALLARVPAGDAALTAHVTLLGQPDLLTLGEVAGVMSVSYKSVQRWVASGKLRTLRTPGGQYRVSRAVLEHVLADSV